MHPIILTITESRDGAEFIARRFDIEGRIDIIEAEQFIATNILEWSHFAAKSHRSEVYRLIARYNEIIRDVETDPSLLIEL